MRHIKNPDTLKFPMKLQHQGVPKKRAWEPWEPYPQTRSCHSSSHPLQDASQQNNETRSNTFVFPRREYPVTQGSRVVRAAKRRTRQDRIHAPPPSRRRAKVVVGCKKNTQDKRTKPLSPIDLHTAAPHQLPQEIDSRPTPHYFPVIKKNSKKTVSSMVMRKQEPLIFPEPRQPKVFPICD